MNINNPQVKEIRDGWESLFDNPNLPLEERLVAFSVLQTVNLIVSLYEEDYVAHQEDVDDLFIAWNKDLHPLLKEDSTKVLEKLIGRLENLKR